MMAEEACMLSSSKRQATNEDDSDSSSSYDSNSYTDNKAQQGVEIKSLTVKFNDRQEIWRSPPTYGTTLSLDLDDNKTGFVWPDGWIEVLKYQSTNVSRSPRQQVSVCVYLFYLVNLCVQYEVLVFWLLHLALVYLYSIVFTNQMY